MECSSLRESNLGDLLQERRLRLGAASFALGLVLAVVLVKLGAPPALRLVLAIPFVIGASGLYMGLFRTCGGLAARGLRDTGDGPTPIVDPEELRRVRVTALKVTALALVTGALATSLFMLV